MIPKLVPEIPSESNSFSLGSLREPLSKARESARAGTRTDGSERRARIQSLGKRLLPGHPAREVGLVSIPQPALIDATTDPDFDPLVRVRMLAAAYRHAVSVNYNATSVFMMKDPTNHPKFWALLEFSDWLERAGCAPATWVQFSFNAWRDVVSKFVRRGAPTADWVYSAKRWDRNRAWRCRPLVQLTQDWSDMWIELLRADPQTREDVARGVESKFPRDSFERRVQHARAETRRVQADVNRIVLLGGDPRAQYR
jgi:hypothetical protein